MIHSFIVNHDHTLFTFQLNCELPRSSYTEKWRLNTPKKMDNDKEYLYVWTQR